MKKNGNGVVAAENGEGAQLLGSGSDSEVQEFALPPRKPGKVSRKSKKATVKVRDVEPSRGSCCSCQLVCHVFLYLLIMGAMGALAWLSYNIKTEMDHLRNRVITMEQSEMAMPGQLEELKQKQKHQDDRVELLSTGDTGLSVANKHLAQLDKQIAKLNKTTLSISASVSSSQKLVALPTTVEDLSKQMASIGSEIESMKEEMATTTSTQRQLLQQVDNMRAELEQIKRNEAVTDVPSAAAVAPVPGVSPTTMSPVQQLTAAAAATKARADLGETDSGVLGSYVEKEVASLTAMVHQLNDTIQACVNTYSVVTAELRANMSVLTNRVSVLEAGGVSVTSGNVTSSPVNLLQLRADMDKLLKGVGGGNSTSGLGDNSFNSLMAQIRNITVAMETLKAQVAQSQADDLNDLNSNLLSNRTVNSLQGILANAAKKFKDENSVSQEQFTELEEAIHNLWEITSQHSNEMVVVKAQVSQLLRTVQNILDTMDVELLNSRNITAGNNTLDIGPDYSAEVVTSPSASIPSLLSSTKAILDGLAATKPAQANKTDVAQILMNGTLATPVNVTVSFNVTELDVALHDGNGTNTTAVMSVEGELHDGNETLHGGNSALNETEAVGNATEPTVVMEVTTEWPHLPPMKGYETPHALEIGFFRWDVNGDGHVNYEDMADFLGPKLPLREDLMAFDADGNGQLELPEFYRAFGFHEKPMHIPTEDEEMAENSDEAENLPPVLAGETKCTQDRLEAKASGLIGQYVPQCTEDGRYRPLQCHASTGYCWCVDELGETIEGTKAGRGIVPSCDEFLGEPLPVPIEGDGDADSEQDINSLSDLLKDFKRSQPDPSN
ncbi:uncharacterized protein LOC144903355 isoform X9 [Branchiostoma floridae x Branchiostoma belcheri]